MKNNVIRLTESDLVKIIEKVISEQGVKQPANTPITYTVRNPEIILTGQNKKTTADVSENLKIFKGAKFIKQGGNMVAKTKYQFVDALGNVITGVGNNSTMKDNKTYSGAVTYGCSTGKYTVNMRTDLMFYDKTLSPMLNKMCQTKTTKTQPTTQAPKGQQTTGQQTTGQQTTGQQTTGQQSVAPSIENITAKRGVMRMGMTGDSVKQVQQMLSKHGYFNAQPTNNFGKITDQAVRAFQTARNLKSDGVVGVATLNLLQGPVVSQEQLATLPANTLQQMQIQTPQQQLQIPQQQLQIPQQQTTSQSGAGEEAVSRRELRQRRRQR
jgi:peptidoglycan hydrolase-like protein with peptidoglycan-binding domain